MGFTTRIHSIPLHPALPNKPTWSTDIFNIPSSSTITISHTTQLAKRAALKLSDAEIAKFASQINSFENLVNPILKSDTKGFDPLVSLTAVQNTIYILPDEIQNSEELDSNPPTLFKDDTDSNKKDGYYVA
ncbi:hypothetical protein BC833DRAFT_621958 [Globomyces pollinis-pini]|nr:hypothetical protein BC833DRAFT_621958 [Globomyces pollinis-pini]